jgi:hypothetical protein
MSPVSRDMARDMLIDELRARSFDDVVDLYVANIKDYDSEDNQFMRRRKWCLCQIHTDDELRGFVEDTLKLLEPLPQGLDEYAISGNDPRNASLWEAWTGVRPYFQETYGGTGWGDGSDIDWGQTIEDQSFDGFEDAANYEQELTDAGIDNTGIFMGEDGKWHVISESGQSG